MDNKENYLIIMLEQAPRFLSLIDRNSSSKTFGCFDREYWNSKTADFSCARKQEGVLTLAMLYSIKNSKNEYYQNKNILRWINAALNYWIKIQQKNGSFDEWYPRENSFVATAFSTYAISETLIQVKNIENRDEIISSLKKAANWLMRKKETRVQNQESGAIAALYNVYLLTQEQKYKESAEQKTRNLLENQDEEGWFMEYGGADIGYLSLTVDYLSKYYAKSKDETALKITKKACEFLKHFLHPNLTAGGEYGSRNTEYLIPDGFEILSNKIKDAAIISNHIRESISKKRGVAPYNFDDRYLTYIGYTWLQAFKDAKKLPKTTALYKGSFTKYFENSKLLVYSSKNIYLISNFAKGGSFRLFLKDKMISDSGVELQTTKGNFTTAALTNNNVIRMNENIFEISGNFSEVNTETMSPMKKLMMIIFQYTFGRSKLISVYVREKLRDRLITKLKLSKIKFKRTIYLEKLKIIDEVNTLNFTPEVKKLILGSKASYACIPSSRYYLSSEINNEPKELSGEFENKIVIKRIFS